MAGLRRRRSGPAGRSGIRNGLREIARRLGAVRDLDVLLEAADEYRADLPVTEQRALEPLLADWRAHREDALVLLIRELDSDGYQRWVDDYREFVRTEGAAVLPVGPVEPHRVRDTAPSHIWAAYEQVRAYEPVLRWADVETLHELRIAGKWLRYTLEFVREALGPESAPLIARVTALQDHLGLMHDADVAASMARAFLVEHAGDLSAWRARRSAATWSAASARSPACGGRSVARGAASRASVPPRPRAGRRRALAASGAPAVRQVRQPVAPGAPAWAAARIAPSRMPASDDPHRVGAVAPQDRVDDDRAGRQQACPGRLDRVAFRGAARRARRRAGRGPSSRSGSRSPRSRRTGRP